MTDELLERIDKILDEQQVRTNRTFFITMATLEYIKRMEHNGVEQTSELPS